eukprot:TRINITY_DN2110_c5_g1_i1.p1 TRINITY_DN2110_c5_g1~~TRINITY_DN2110_c5_g1_i1.p1  ORF type:complete len:570 (+),score=144.40 TRINITY_DN2110_c5_g1_i1:80-1789(+)
MWRGTARRAAAGARCPRRGARNSASGSLAPAPQRGSGGGGGGGSWGGGAGRVAAGAAGAALWWTLRQADASADEPLTGVVLTNYSETHSATPRRLYTPADSAAVCRLLQAAAAEGRKLRPLGAGLSPNGTGFVEPDGDVISLQNMDTVLSVDPVRMEVTCQAGCTVRQLLDALGEHGMTMQNFSSIMDMSIAGWTQVAAHGTGAAIPTVEQQIVEMRLATPAAGELTLSETSHPELFRFARVGLGSLGVVTQVTLRCVPKFRLRETTVVEPRAEVRRKHAARLKQHRHLRYMWLPHTDRVVVVSSDMADESDPPAVAPPPERLATAPLRDLLQRASGRDEQGLSFAQYRDKLLYAAPLDTQHVRAVNAAEALFWQGRQGVRVEDSADVLGFQCGGHQWVYETCFPAGTLERPSLADIDYMETVLKQVESQGIPAPCPIEQRWTCGCSSPMSPSHGGPGDLFSWVGVIMYLPPGEPELRREVTRCFAERYRAAVAVAEQRFDAVPHWAKIEGPPAASADPDGRQRALAAAMRERLRHRYGAALADFRAMRQRVDPTGVLSHPVIDWATAA